MFGEYVSSKLGTIKTLTLSSGRQIQVACVDGDTPYIVSGNNTYNYNLAQVARSNSRRCIYRDSDGNCIDHLYAQGQQQERQERQEQARQERQRQQAQRDRVARGRQIRDSRSSKGQSRQSRRSQPNRFSRSSGSRMPKRYLNRPSQMDYGYGYGGGYDMDMSRMSIQERRRMMNRDFY